MLGDRSVVADRIIADQLIHANLLSEADRLKATCFGYARRCRCQETGVIHLVTGPTPGNVIQRKPAKQRENVPKCGFSGQSPTTRSDSDNTGKKWLSRSQIRENPAGNPDRVNSHRELFGFNAW